MNLVTLDDRRKATASGRNIKKKGKGDIVDPSVSGDPIIHNSMYGLIRDSLFTPKNLLAYRNKSGFFTFIYIILLSVLISIGAIVYYVGFNGNSVITEESTGCSIVEGNLVCAGAAYDAGKEFALYGISVYFINSGDDFSYPDKNCIVFQSNNIYFYVKDLGSFSLHAKEALTISDTFDGYIRDFSNSICTLLILFAFVGNILVVLFVSLMGTIPFLRLMKFIEYKTLFKLVVFAMTPFSVLLTFYNLLNLPEFLVIVLMLFSYRSLFVLQRELTQLTFEHLAKNAGVNYYPGMQSPESESPEPDTSDSPIDEAGNQTGPEEDPYAPSDDSLPDKDDDSEDQ